MNNRKKPKVNQQHENVSHKLAITETKFTPGPYAIVRDEDGVDDYFVIVTQAERKYVASVQFWDDAAKDTERARANARLLVKAPEMFQALKELLHSVATGTRIDTSVEFSAIEHQAHLLIAEVESNE